MTRKQAIDEQNYIQTAKRGFGFGHGGDYKYRVMDRQKIGAIHHTNDMDDAKKYFHKCREYWLEQDELANTIPKKENNHDI